MTYSLPADIQSRIDAQLATGEFANADEVLRSAIEALERRQASLQQVRTMVAEAEADIAAGRVGKFDRDDIKRSVRQRIAQQNTSG